MFDPLLDYAQCCCESLGDMCRMTMNHTIHFLLLILLTFLVVHFAGGKLITQHQSQSLKQGR